MREGVTERGSKRDRVCVSKRQRVTERVSKSERHRERERES